MINRELRKLLLRELKISRQALSQRAQRLKSKYGPMSTTEAVYVIAHQSGIDLSRFLTISEIDRIRAIVPRELPPFSPTIKRRAVKFKKKAEITSLSYPLVPKKMIFKGQRIGGESFPKMFVLENSIRFLVIKLLSRDYGKAWWKKAVSRGIRDSAQRIMDKEKKFPHRKKRGVHPINYSNFIDLKEIIIQNRNKFVNVIPDMRWFEVKMDGVYMARNSLAHNTDISENDQSEINLFFSEWAQLLETKKNQLI